MPSPDFSEYIDLTVNDLQPVDIYNLARDYALVALPEFNPRAGTIEDAMLEAMSYVSGLVTGAVNRLPNGLMEGILRLMGFYRAEATLASGSVIFSSIDDTGLTIPAGTQVGFAETTADGEVLHVFETTSSMSIPEGSTESDPVQIAAVDAGRKPVITDGTSMIILTPITRLFEAIFDGELNQGSETENDDEFFNRATTYLSSLSRSLATADQVTNYVLSTYGDAFRVRAYDLTKLQKFVADEVVFDSTGVGASFNIESTSPTQTYKTLDYTNSSSLVSETLLSTTPFADTETTYSYVRVQGTSVPDYDGVWQIDGTIDTSDEPSSYYLIYDYGDGTATNQILYPTQTPTVEFLDQVAFDANDALGSITVFIGTSTGASLSAEDKANIADDIRDRSIAGLSVYVTDIIIAPITVEVEISVSEGYPTIEVRNAVDSYLTNFLSPETFQFGTIIRRNSVLSAISQIDGVAFVSTLTMTPDDENIAYLDLNNDIRFNFKGTLPQATVTVTSV